jgi:tetratricopeptide (TPR) repeat protein
MDLILNDESKKPTLCLNMIVKNESKIITRLFDSVLSVIDCYCICDTGSTDDTVKIINEYFYNKGIPGKVVTEPFKNFCHNRNVALQCCLGMSEYIILLDADMVIEITNFDKRLLNNADSFYILQGNDSFYYQNMRIVKNDGLYSYVGVTHEYINTPVNNKISGFEKKDLFIRDLGDGGSKQDKYERDIRLLIDGIKDEPKNERYHFYLANSYHDSGKFNEAIDFYKKRIELGGWQEEVWYSYYRIGLCYKNLGKMSDAICSWMEGYNYYSDRLEGLYEIIQHYRIISKHKLCELFYKLAEEVLNKNLDRDSYLFLHDDVYSSKIYYEYTIFASYIGSKNINNEVIKVLNNSKDGNEVNNMLQNMKFYKDVLKQKGRLTLDNTIVSNINNEATTLKSSSSCLIPIANNEGYRMNIRFVNYHINNEGGYLNCDKYIITVNKYVEFNKDFTIKNEKWIELKFDDRRYIGIEDVRIFNDVETNKLLFIGTGFHRNNNIGIVTGEYNIQNFSLKESEIVPNFTNSSCEKNWVFVDYKNSTHVIYNWHPLQICKINNESNLLSLVETKKMPNIFSRIRGSTCGFKYSKKVWDSINGNISINIVEEEIWVVAHLVSYENPRHYYHLIAVFDSNMNLLRYSAPFKFEGEPIEYCLSIIVEDEQVLINYSTWDRTTRIGVYDKKYIDLIVKYT